MKKFCVIVPAHNESLMIGQTLKGLIDAGACPEDIYLMDDYSSDNTGEIGALYGVNVYRNDPNLGKALTILKAISEFDLTDRYEFIATMDADTLVDISYFEEMLKSFSDPEVVVACGRPISQAYNWLTAYRALCYANGHFVYRKAQGKMGVICIAPGCSVMYRATIFDKLNWMNDTVAEDMYVTIQVHHERMGKVAYAGAAKVYTQTPRTLRDYVKQMFRWNTGTWQVIRDQHVYMSNRFIDWECKFLWTEGLITAFLRLLFPLVALMLPMFADRLHWMTDVGLISQDTLEYFIALSTPWYSGSVAFVVLVVGGLLMSLPATCVFALLERRWDIVKYVPFYPIIWYVDAFYFLKGFWRAIIQRESVEWFSPSRYMEKEIS